MTTVRYQGTEYFVMDQTRLKYCRASNRLLYPVSELTDLRTEEALKLIRTHNKAESKRIFR